MHPSSNASLGEWLDYVESIHPTEIELGLERLKLVANRLLNQTQSSFVFTVAGTNGKGTTTAALSVLAEAAGQSVGWYSSPHLQHFNERIRINNKPVDDALITQGLFAVENARQQVSLSYFEFTTLAAFWIFQQARLDVWVLEVGLGGRLDAVNIINADIAVITNIGLDHQGYLGDTKEQIGYEKAGIARPNRPVVLGSQDIPSTVFAHLKQIDAQIFSFGDTHGVRDGHDVYYQGGTINLANSRLPMANVSAALQAFELSPFALAPSLAKTALETVTLAGRLQRLTYLGREVVVDVGHNPHAGHYIAQQLRAHKYHCIIGMLSDKDAAGFVDALSPIMASVSYIDLQVPRGMTAQALNQASGREGFCFNSLETAVTQVLEKQDDKPLFIGGSFYTVCDALNLVEN